MVRSRGQRHNRRDFHHVLAQFSGAKSTARLCAVSRSYKRMMGAATYRARVLVRTRAGYAARGYAEIMSPVPGAAAYREGVLVRARAVFAARRDAAVRSQALEAADQEGEVVGTTPKTPAGPPRVLTQMVPRRPAGPNLLAPPARPPRPTASAAQVAPSPDVGTSAQGLYPPGSSSGSRDAPPTAPLGENPPLEEQSPHPASVAGQFHYGNHPEPFVTFHFIDAMDDAHTTFFGLVDSIIVEKAGRFAGAMRRMYGFSGRFSARGPNGRWEGQVPTSQLSELRRFFRRLPTEEAEVGGTTSEQHATVDSRER